MRRLLVRLYAKIEAQIIVPDFYLDQRGPAPAGPIPNFSLPFRLQRAIRVIPIDASSQATAIHAFDNVVAQIEQCIATEADAGTILQHWTPAGDDESCAACDFRHCCPNPFPHTAQHAVSAPTAP